MDVKFILKCVVVVLLLGGLLALAGTSVGSVVSYWSDLLSFVGGVLVISATRLAGITGKIMACEPLFKLITLSFGLTVFAFLVKWLFKGRTNTIN